MAPTNTTAIEIRVAPGTVLDDNTLWTNRFEVRSASSGRVYIVSQNKEKRHWGCSCPGWKRHRKCHHLEEIGLPSHEMPYEVRLTEGK